MLPFKLFVTKGSAYIIVEKCCSKCYYDFSLTSDKKT